MFKKTFMLCLTLMLVLCSFSLAIAADQEVAHESNISPRWTRIHNIYNGLSINANGQANMFSQISAYSSVENVTISTYLQRQENNSWVTVRNWSQDYDGPFAFWSGSWYVNKGYNYRVVTYFYAYDGSAQDGAILVSGSQYY